MGQNYLPHEFLVPYDDIYNVASSMVPKPPPKKQASKAKEPEN
jgi:hypothetical protein